MENYLLIDTGNGGLLYQVFYTLAFLAAYAILVFEGIKRKFPLTVWFLVLAAIRLGEVAGSKLFSFSGAEWRFMLEHRTLIENTEKTMFGGALIAVAAYFAARYFLRFRQPAWDTLAYVIPAGTCISSIGCFFYGCCFGTPSGLPWAVQYPVMSLTHYHQFRTGALLAGDTLSLPVHPVQLYESAGALMALFLVYAFRNRWKANGSLLLSSLVLFALMRFSVDFFRDPLSNKSGGEMLWLLKQVQWQYLAFALMMSALLFFRERRPEPAISHVNYEEPSLRMKIIFLLFLAIVFLSLHSWFTLPEIVVLNIALLPAVISTVRDIWLAFERLEHRWAYAIAVLLPLFLMSQTLPQTQIDSAATASYRTYHTVGGGLATGNYSNEKTNYQGSGCDMVTNSNYFEHKYTVFGGGYSFTREAADRSVRVTYGGNLMLGSYSQTDLESEEAKDIFLADLGGFARYDAKWFGIGGGLHLGNMVYTNGDSYKDSSTPIDKAYFRTPVFPMFYMRAGIERIFFADVHIADQFPSSMPGMAFQASLGTGFGIRNGTVFRIGYSFLDDDGFFAAAYLPLGDKVVIEPFYYWSKPPYSSPSQETESQFSIGLSYRFGHK